MSTGKSSHMPLADWRDLSSLCLLNLAYDVTPGKSQKPGLNDQTCHKMHGREGINVGVVPAIDNGISEFLSELSHPLEGGACCDWGQYVICTTSR